MGRSPSLTYAEEGSDHSGEGSPKCTDIHRPGVLRAESELANRKVSAGWPLPWGKPPGDLDMTWAGHRQRHTKAHSRPGLCEYTGTIYLSICLFIFKTCLQKVKKGDKVVKGTPEGGSLAPSAPCIPTMWIAPASCSGHGLAAPPSGSREHLNWVPKGP